MKIAICDDDCKCNEKLEEMLSAYARSKEIKKYNIYKYKSGCSLVEEFRPGKFDFIFLDIEMPGTDGFSTAQRIRELDLDVDIVFITHLKDSVQRGFDYNAKGYLYKDVTQEDIDKRMDKLIDERLRSKKGGFMNVKLIKGGTVMLSLARILYFESKSHYISAVSETDTHIFIDSIGNLTGKLENTGFIRISQSYLVNVEHVFHVTGNKVTIKKGPEITIGRSYKHDLIKALNKKEKEKWQI